MVAPDITHIHHSSSTAGHRGEKSETCGFHIKNCYSESTLMMGREVEDDVFMMDDPGQGKGEDLGHSESTKLDIDKISKAEAEMVAVVDSPLVKEDRLLSDIHGGEYTPVGQKGEIGDNKLHGIKRPSIDQEPSVCIRYSFLPRSSKRKLEELLKQWSDWHSKNCSSAEDPTEDVESGEETHFPALNVGLDNKLTVAYWIDNEVCKRQRKDDSAPLYDRGYAFGLTSDDGPIDKRRIVPDLREVGRCFNCGSYSHSLNKCPKPHNAVAVKSARKQFKSKRGSAGPVIPKRYYQDATEGRYSGLKPGTLTVETRELLGLGELDPPPWLNKMRELGYPPGYLEAEDQSSGIEIFGDEEAGERGNSLKPEVLVSRRKETVEFPGINAPVPQNADPKSWEGPQGPPISDFSERQTNYSEPWRPKEIACSSSPFGYMNLGLGPGSSPVTPNFGYKSYGHDLPPCNGPFSSRGIPSLAPTRNSFHEDALRGMPIVSPNYGRYSHEPTRPSSFHEDSQRGMPIPGPDYGRYPREPMRASFHENAPRGLPIPMRPFFHEHSPIDPVFSNALHSPLSNGQSFPGRNLY